MLAKRISVILPKGIFHIQICFVKGRAISDNILLVQKLVHDTDNKIRGGNVILKLDIYKAYDNVNWSYLFKMLYHFGFPISFPMSLKTLLVLCGLITCLMGSLMNFPPLLMGLDKVILFSQQYLSSVWRTSQGFGVFFFCFKSFHVLPYKRRPSYF